MRCTVQLWTMKNYHYYLKQEIITNDASNKRFRGMFWHPEKALTLYLIGECGSVSGGKKADHTPATVCTRTFVWETYTSHLAMPHDTATVAVVDGGELAIAARAVRLTTLQIAY